MFDAIINFLKNIFISIRSFIFSIFLYAIFCALGILYQFFMYKVNINNDFHLPIIFNKSNLSLPLFQFFIIFMPFFVILMPFFYIFYQKINFFDIIIKIVLNIVFFFLVLYFYASFLKTKLFFNKIINQINIYYLTLDKEMPLKKSYFFNTLMKKIIIVAEHLRNFDGLTFLSTLAIIIVIQFFASSMQKRFYSSKELAMFNFNFICIFTVVIYASIYYLV